MQGGSLPQALRAAVHLGDFRIVVAGLRASERPPCTGACEPPSMVLGLLDGQGSVCFRQTLPDEHRLGPVGRPGGAIFVAGPRRVHAVSWDGRLLATTVVEGLVGSPVSLEDGGAAFTDGEGYLVVFRPDGTLRYRKRPQTPAAPLALAARPSGGVLVAFGQEVRGYDADGVELWKRPIGDLASRRGLAGLGPRAFWVWSSRGAYRFREDGSLGDRLPPNSPKDGQLFAADLGRGGVFYALYSERGFFPIKLTAFLPTGAPRWSRPFTGDRPGPCRLLAAPKERLAVLCEGEPQGRAVVRDAEGLTSFDEELVRPQVAFGPDGAFGVADDTRARDMSERCRVRLFTRRGEARRTWDLAGRCPLLWADARGTMYLGHRRLDGQASMGPPPVSR